MGKKPADYNGPAKEIIDSLSKDCENLNSLNWNIMLNKCERAIEVDPDCYPAYVIVGTYFSGTMHSDVKDLVKMDDYYAKAFAAWSDPPNAWMADWIIMTLDEGLRDYERLARYLREYAKRDPSYATLHYMMRTYKKLNDKEGALAAFTELLNKHPDNKKGKQIAQEDRKVEGLMG